MAALSGKGDEIIILNKIDHFVVLVLENRSFDSIVGWLYDEDNNPPFNSVPRGQPFDGVSGKNLFNPIPRGLTGSQHRIVPVGKGVSLVHPNPNPGEMYPQINTQLFGTIIPPDNKPPFKPPYNLPLDIPAIYPMNGFVKDYIQVLKTKKIPLKYENYKIIMDCLTPDRVLIISQLAYNYAISDQWFCSVPSQTYPNRSFLNAAASSGFVNNKPYRKWLKNDAVTIFNRIEEKEDPDITWKVYYDSFNFIPLTLSIHLPKLYRYTCTNFSHMKHFYHDAKQGTLPSYSLIEPRFHIIPNDEHPPHDIARGEKLISNVYHALRRGPKWENTLLIITYDEHGGCYDHVQPPLAVPPAKGFFRGEQGFRFDRLGLRVPTILVSPYIKQGTVFRAKSGNQEIPLDHTSIIKTITKRFGLESLTDRDKSSMDIGQVLTMEKPRIDCPLLNPV